VPKLDTKEPTAPKLDTKETTIPKLDSKEPNTAKAETEVLKNLLLLELKLKSLILQK
jgi:hypothetical protein